ncbi:hypothetical protein OGAPHI_002018 [Ogataea philodendri]|uniref:Carrier protein YMC1, mitochondrial n=1 Tax=Ogataea philodendri TaxID=1378263 RepID=A0A9P8PBK2_9ASCO|nr:uncharacterized protein OGAPHI_002018 [Ogataea philodendri]KAH3668264.1 hypothetical protein OGAPHI_002018 [Ogataea philodendri]
MADDYRAAKDVFAGTIGGIAQVLVGQPFDTTKVRIQSAKGNVSPVKVVRDLIANEGPLAFYKGTLTPLVGVGVCVSIQFGVNEFMKRVFTNANGPGTHLSMGQFYLCGAAAGFANGFVAAPIEHIRIRLQLQTSGNAEFHGPVDVLKKLYHTGGIKLIYRGLGPTLAREGFGGGMYFLTFEALVKNEIHTKNIQRKDIENWRLILFGALAGYGMWLSIYPIDVIKSNMQTDNYHKPVYKNALAATRGIVQQNGLKGLVRGFTPTILRAAPANAATFFAFETTMRYLN